MKILFCIILTAALLASASLAEEINPLVDPKDPQKYEGLNAREESDCGCFINCLTKE